MQHGELHVCNMNCSFENHFFSRSDKLLNEKEKMFARKVISTLLDRSITGLAKQGLNKGSFIYLMNHIGNKLFIELCLAVFIKFHLY